MNKKSIIYIITKSVWGGAAKYVLDVSSGISDEFDVTIAAGGKDKLYTAAKEKNIPYFTIEGFQRKVNPIKDVLAFFEIAGLILQAKPDIVHTNSSKAGSVAGLAGWCCNIFSSKKAALIFTAHGWAFAEDRPEWQIKLIKLISKFSCLFYDKIICVSENDKRIAIKNNIAPERKLVVIHNGIDAENIAFLNKQEAQKKLLGKETSSLVIGTIAEWTKNKGLEYLIEACKSLKMPFELFLVGSGENPDKERITETTKESNNIHLIEYLPNAASYLTAADIFVLPSIKEGLPYTVIEAMLANVPVIATNVGGIPEIIGNNEGILVEPKNSRLLAEKITFLAKNRNEAKRISEKGNEKVKKEFSLERMIEKTKALY